MTLSDISDMYELTAEDEFYFQWHITEHCNRGCCHRYQDGQSVEELGLPELLKIVDIMENAVLKWDKIGTLSITGGEPFIRRYELYGLLGRIEITDSLIYYDILTNGSLITKEEVKILSQFKKLRRVQVSLEGATEKTNDLIRGTGAFKDTLNAIHCLKDVGIEISVMTTVSRLNCYEIPDLINLCEREGVSALALERLIPEGGGIGMINHILSSEELHKLYYNIYLLAQRNLRVRLLLYRPLFSIIAPDDPTVGALCSAGNNALTIMPDGTVYPCRRLPISLGNILTDGIYKIWYDSDILWKIRNPDNLNDKCRYCDF